MDKTDLRFVYNGFYGINGFHVITIEKIPDMMDMEINEYTSQANSSSPI